jgi:hypothetical protein
MSEFDPQAAVDAIRESLLAEHEAEKVAARADAEVQKLVVDQLFAIRQDILP